MTDETPNGWYGLGLPEVHLRVRGTPAPQGSKRHVGKGIMVESSKLVKPWREDVRTAAESWIMGRVMALHGSANRELWTPLDGALRGSMVFTFARPKGHYRTGRNAHLLREGAPSHPIGPPDLSKLVRSTEDALTSAGLWRDDARVVQYVNAAKVYAGEDRDALEAPGVSIRLWRVSPLDT